MPTRLAHRWGRRLSSNARRLPHLAIALVILAALAFAVLAPAARRPATALDALPPSVALGPAGSEARAVETLNAPAAGETLNAPAAGEALDVPAAGETLADSNLVVVAGTTAQPGAVEVSFDDGRTWTPAVSSSSDPHRWRAFWVPPEPGTSRLQVRAGGIPVPGLTRDLRLTGEWTTRYLIDDPYAVPGIYRTGQIHRHTANSFDGHKEMTPDVVAGLHKHAGYGFVIFTDHDVISKAPAQNGDSFLALPGYESTGRGHIGAWFVNSVVDHNLPAQARIDAIVAQGGIAALNHPGWQVGWAGEEVIRLRGYRAIEIFNAVTTNEKPERLANNLELWRRAINYKGIDDKIWGIAVSDAHDDRTDGGWIAAKIDRLSPAAVKTALAQGSFYASTGPHFAALGVARGRIVAASPDARDVRFLDDQGRVVAEAPAEYAEYQPTGTERWLRVEAVDDQGRRAWSQPFWLRPNLPTVAVTSATSDQVALTGATLPGAEVEVRDEGTVVAQTTADPTGHYQASVADDGDLADLSVTAIGPTPDRIPSPARLARAARRP